MVLSGQEVRVNKAEALIKAARFLFENGYYNDCVSRAYYVIYHSTIALLAIKKNMVRDRWDHTELHKALLDSFCKKGFLLNARDGETFSELKSFRNDSDYEMKSLNKRVTEKLLNKAMDLVEKIEGVL